MIVHIWFRNFAKMKEHDCCRFVNYELSSLTHEYRHYYRACRNVGGAGGALLVGRARLRRRRPRWAEAPRRTHRRSGPVRPVVAW